MVESQSKADGININSRAAADVFLINPSGLSFQWNAAVEVHYRQSLDAN